MPRECAMSEHETKITDGVRGTAEPTANHQTDASGPAEVYQERCAHFAAERDRYETQRERLSQRIFMLGAALVGSLLLGFLGGVPLVLIAAPVCLVFLIISAVRQGGILRLRDHAATLLAINNEGPLRLARDWTALPLR